MAATTACSEPGCDRPRWARGLCNAHYQRVRKAERRAQNPDRLNGYRPAPDLGERLASLRLAVEAAHARLSQAVIVSEYPHVGAEKGVTVRGLIDEALDALDRGRY